MIDDAPSDTPDRERRSPNFRRFLSVAYRGKWVGALVAVMIAVAAIIVFRSVEFKYRASLTVVPAQQETGLSRNLSGLASLAGVSLARGQTVSPFALYLQMLHSHDVAESIQRNQAIMTQLFPRRWNAASQTWRAPTGFVADLSRFVQDIVGMNVSRDAKPSVADVNKLLDEKLSVVENRRDSLAEISFANPDPKFAADFIRAVDRIADEKLRTRGLERTTRFRNYLKEQLRIVELADLRQPLIEALTDQEKQRMIALSGLAFAAEPVGGIALTARASEPNPVLLLASGAIAAAALGLLAAYLRGRWRKVDV